MGFNDWIREIEAHTQSGMVPQQQMFNSRQTIDINSLANLINNNYGLYQAYSDRKENKKRSSSKKGNLMQRVSSGTAESP